MLKCQQALEWEEKKEKLVQWDLDKNPLIKKPTEIKSAFASKIPVQSSLDSND